MTRRKQGGRAALLPNNLPQLQNLIKRDPQSYRDEFLQQWRHYVSLLSLFQLKPDGASKEFGELVTFLSHVSNCYPEVCKGFPEELRGLVSEGAAKMDPELRRVLVTALILLRNKGIIDEIRSVFGSVMKSVRKTLLYLGRFVTCGACRRLVGRLQSPRGAFTLCSVHCRSAYAGY